MIVISSSLPKSGSTLIVRVQEDLLNRCEPKNGQTELRKRFDSAYVEKLKPLIVLRILMIHLRHGSVIVKTHAGPTWVIRWLIRLGIAKATYCYRDPRDVVLSSIDHCRRDRDEGTKHRPFDAYDTIEHALPQVERLTHRWKAWKAFGKAHFIRYEGLMADKPGHVLAMARYLGWDVTAEQVTEMLKAHEPRKGTSYNFNKGTTFRFRSEMKPEEIARSSEVLRDAIVSNGYDL